MDVSKIDAVPPRAIELRECPAYALTELKECPIDGPTEIQHASVTFTVS